MDKKPLSPEELYDFGLRQSRVGTPYFLDNDMDNLYIKKLKGMFANVLEEVSFFLDRGLTNFTSLNFPQLHT